MLPIADEPMPEDGEFVDAVTRLADLAVASKCLQPSEIYECQKIVEAGKSLMIALGRKLILDNPSTTLRTMASGDGTPTTTRERFHFGLLGLEQKRIGSSLREHYGHRLYLKSEGNDQPTVVMSEPRALTQGKKAHNLFAAELETFPHPREAGHRGYLVQGNCWDRAMSGPLSKKAVAFDEYVHKVLTARGVLDAPLLRLRCFRVTNGCGAHDGGNSLKRAVEPYKIPGKQFGKNVYLSVWGLRKAMDIVVKELTPWLLAVLRASDEEWPEAAEVWESLRVDPKWVEELVNLGLRWKNNHLYVRRSLFEHPDTHERVKACLVHLWEFRNHNDARLLTVGDSSKTMLLGRMTGLKSVVQQARARDANSDYYIHHFEKCGKDEIHFMAVNALVSATPDIFVAAMADDDRLAKHVDEYSEMVQSEVDYMDNMPEYVLRNLADEVEVPTDQFRDECICGAYVAQAFLEFRALEVARAEPYTLGRGDVVANLAALGRLEECPKERNMKQMWQLLKLGEAPEQLQTVPKNINETSFTSFQAEQGHNPKSQLMRNHPEYSNDTLVARAGLMLMAPLVGEAKEELAVADALATVQRLQRRSPNKVTGKNVYCKGLIARKAGTSRRTTRNVL